MPAPFLDDAEALRDEIAPDGDDLVAHPELGFQVEDPKSSGVH